MGELSTTIISLCLRGLRLPILFTLSFVCLKNTKCEEKWIRLRTRKFFRVRVTALEGSIGILMTIEMEEASDVMLEVYRLNYDATTQTHVSQVAHRTLPTRP